jgi:hypothetical protein
MGVYATATISKNTRIIDDGLRWLHHAQIETALIDPGKPWQKCDRRIVQREVPATRT